MLAKNTHAIFFVLLLTLFFGTQVSAEPGFLVYKKSSDINGLLMMKAQYGNEDNAGRHKTLLEEQ